MPCSDLVESGRQRRHLPESFDLQLPWAEHGQNLIHRDRWSPIPRTSAQDRPPLLPSARAFQGVLLKLQLQTGSIPEGGAVPKNRLVVG